MVPKALDTLVAALDTEDSLTAAVHILKASGIFGYVPPAGETRPEVIQAQRTLAAWEREHIAERTQDARAAKEERRVLDRLAGNIIFHE
jgi:hypothetical protein